MTDDLIAFLRARIGEDEAGARAAMWDDGPSAVWTDRPPQASYEQHTVVDYCDDGVVVVTPENADDDGVGQYIARHDPARVPREVEAKRRIVAQYESAREQVRHPVSAENRVRARVAQGELEDVLRLLALPYADHPDYEEACRP